MQPPADICGTIAYKNGGIRDVGRKVKIKNIYEDKLRSLRCADFFILYIEVIFKVWLGL